MKCWICGGEGSTGEHKAKASDLRALFGRVTQDDPIFLHTDQRKNQKLGSIKAEKLKSSARICANCNNALTASNDRAWERLSEFLRTRRLAIKGDDVIDLEDVFPGSVEHSMLNVHLFFVKLFGCAIGEADVPIDRDSFAQAILQQCAHPKIYLAFGPNPEDECIAARSNMETAHLDGRCVYATWFYIVGSVLVNVMYAEPRPAQTGAR